MRVERVLPVFPPLVCHMKFFLSFLLSVVQNQYAT